MRSLECRLVRQQIDELELDERPSERATAHLAVCAACRDFRAERTELRQLVGSLESVVAPADFEMRLRARIAREQSTSQEPLFARLIRMPALAAAALFVVVGGALVWVAQKDIEPSTNVATVQHPHRQRNRATQQQSEAIQRTRRLMKSLGMFPAFRVVRFDLGLVGGHRITACCRPIHSARAIRLT